MNDQRQMWNARRRRDGGRDRSDEPARFARECAAMIPAGSSVLELGCGWGQDAAFFASEGHAVTATDFSEVTIEQNREHFGAGPNLWFLVMDTAGAFPFGDGAFDVVYAHLSLHYFTDEVTRRVFREIRRVLKVGGLLLFLCKTVRDPLYGRGRMIEPDMFELDGHVRHFFSEEYARSCLGTEFEVLQIESGDDEFYGRGSSFIRVYARSC